MNVFDAAISNLKQKIENIKRIIADLINEIQRLTNLISGLDSINSNISSKKGETMSRLNRNAEGIPGCFTRMYIEKCAEILNSGERRFLDITAMYRQKSVQEKSDKENEKRTRENEIRSLSNQITEQETMKAAQAIAMSQQGGAL